MGFRFRKSIKIGPARVNLSKSGIGYSVGTKGFRVTKKAGGGTRTTASIPGTGISYTKDSGSKKKSIGASLHRETNKSTVTNISKTTKPLKKSWFSAVLMAIIGFLLVGVLSFIAILIVGMILSIFIPFSDTVTYVLLFGIPILLASATAVIAFHHQMPKSEEQNTNNPA